MKPMKKRACEMSEEELDKEIKYQERNHFLQAMASGAAVLIFIAIIILALYFAQKNAEKDYNYTPPAEAAAEWTKAFGLQTQKIVCVQHDAHNYPFIDCTISHGTAGSLQLIPIQCADIKQKVKGCKLKKLD